MKEQFIRTQLLVGEGAIDRLANCRVAVFGVGGVGGYVCEALVRSGVGELDIIDDDKIALSNLNRQIIATHSSIGRYKVDVMKERMLDINPEVRVNAYRCFFLPENANQFPFAKYDYIVDAIDTVTAKLELVMKAKEYNVPIISAMGAGNKLDPGRFKIVDIYDTDKCPLARVMRKELKKRHIDSLKVVFSDELALTPIQEDNVEDTEAEPSGHPKRRSTPGSTAFVPGVAGLMLAGEVVRNLIFE